MLWIGICYITVQAIQSVPVTRKYGFFDDRYDQECLIDSEQAEGAWRPG